MNASRLYPQPTSNTLRLGLLTHHNPFDRRAFSGTVYFATRALKRCPNVQLSILGPHRAPRLIDRLLRRSSPEVTLDDISLDNLDAVVGLVGSKLLDPLLETMPNIPVIHVTDATPAFLRDVYGWKVPAEADVVEARIARRASATVYSSDAMAARAPADLNLPGFQPSAIAFGVNIDTRPNKAPHKPPLSPLNLLFVGLDWERKGGDIAIATLNALRETGVDARLTIVGRCPERYRHHEAVTYVGFLNKNKAHDAALLNRLYAEAHLFLLPSRGDCTPMVLAEAMSFGTPVLASNIGGIQSVIGGNGAGRVMPTLAAPQEWVNAVAEATSDRDTYLMMSDAAFERANSALSWDGWSRQLTQLINEIVAGQAQSLRKVV